MAAIQSALRLSLVTLAVNAALAAAKIVAGVLGNSYVLIADGVESCADLFSSVVVWAGLRVAALPPDANHPYGHGKAEAIASAIVSLSLLGAAVILSVQSFREILFPKGPPEPFTLGVLIAVILIKELMFRRVAQAGASLGSAVLKADAWHHRSDALTSAAAFIGITIALVGGPTFATADDWAALLACAIIAWNGIRILRGTLDELMDASVSPEIIAAVRRIACEVEGVVDVEKCRVRKIGLHLALDIHVVVNGELTVRHGHTIAHLVEERLRASQHQINHVTVHIEPDASSAQRDPLT